MNERLQEKIDKVKEVLAKMDTYEEQDWEHSYGLQGVQYYLNTINNPEVAEEFDENKKDRAGKLVWNPNNIDASFYWICKDEFNEKEVFCVLKIDEDMISSLDGKYTSRGWDGCTLGYDDNGSIRSILVESGDCFSARDKTYYLLDESQNKMMEFYSLRDDMWNDDIRDLCYSEDGKIIAKRSLLYKEEYQSYRRDINGVLTYVDVVSGADWSEERIEPVLEFYDAEKDEFTTHKKCSELSDREKEFLAISYFQPFPEYNGNDSYRSYESHMDSISHYKGVVEEYCKIKGAAEIDGYELEVLSSRIKIDDLQKCSDRDEVQTVVNKIISNIKDKNAEQPTISIKDIKGAIKEHEKDEKSHDEQ